MGLCISSIPCPKPPPFETKSGLNKGGGVSDLPGQMSKIFSPAALCMRGKMLIFSPIYKGKKLIFLPMEEVNYKNFLACGAIYKGEMLFRGFLERHRRENFGKLHRLHRGFTVILERRRRENFGKLHRLHKGFTVILERRRRKILATYTAYTRDFKAILERRRREIFWQLTPPV